LLDEIPLKMLNYAERFNKKHIDSSTTLRISLPAGQAWFDYAFSFGKCCLEHGNIYRADSAGKAGLIQSTTLKA
jgi:hypothetical protein